MLVPTRGVFVANTTQRYDSILLFQAPHHTRRRSHLFFFFLNDPPPPDIHSLPLPAALPIWGKPARNPGVPPAARVRLVGKTAFASSTVPNESKSVTATRTERTV